jgi:hypothetical protein
MSLICPLLPSGGESAVPLEDHVSQTTAVVNFKGSVDVMVSPLMLEALQRYALDTCNANVISSKPALVDMVFCHWE